MTEGAYVMHTHMGRFDNDFYGKTQALTVAFDGTKLDIYAHHAVQVAREDADVEAAYALGVNSYIVKPVEFEKFIDVAAQIDLYWCVLNQRAI